MAIHEPGGTPMHDIVFVRGQVRDAEELAEFAARTFSDTFAHNNDPGDLEAHLRNSYGVAQQSAELSDPDVTTILARRDDVLVGYAQVRRSTPPDCVTVDEVVEVHRFYLDRGMQGSGLAGLLMDEVRKAAREFGARHLWLGVWEKNPRAISFYEKSGYSDVGSHTFWFGPDKQTDRVFVARVEPG